MRVWGEKVVIPIDFFSSDMTFCFIAADFFAVEIYYFLINPLVEFLKLVFTLDGV